MVEEGERPKLMLNIRLVGLPVFKLEKQISGPIKLLVNICNVGGITLGGSGAPKLGVGWALYFFIANALFTANFMARWLCTCL